MMNAAQMQARLAAEITKQGELNWLMTNQPAQPDFAVLPLTDAVARQRVKRQAATILDAEAAVASPKGG